MNAALSTSRAQVVGMNWIRGVVVLDVWVIRSMKAAQLMVRGGHMMGVEVAGGVMENKVFFY